MNTDFYVTVLGSGAAISTHTRNCSGQIVHLHGFRMLIDCGEATQIQLRVCHERLQSIELVCISHLHGDHFFGLPGLLSTMQLCGREASLTVVGPLGLRSIMDSIFNLSGSHIDYPIEYHELDYECLANGLQLQVFCNDKCTVRAFALRHSVPSFGYIVEDVPKKGEFPHRYAYCCDTAYFEELAQQVEGVDLLCMESTYLDSYAERAVQHQHSTASQAATVARDAHAGQLLLTHFSNRFKEPQAFLDEASPIFPNVILAEDCKRYGVF